VTSLKSLAETSLLASRISFNFASSKLNSKVKVPFAPGSCGNTVVKLHNPGTFTAVNAFKVEAGKDNLASPANGAAAMTLVVSSCR